MAPSTQDELKEKVLGKAVIGDPDIAAACAVPDNVATCIRTSAKAPKDSVMSSSGSDHPSVFSEALRFFSASGVRDVFVAPDPKAENGERFETVNRRLTVSCGFRDASSTDLNAAGNELVFTISETTAAGA